MDARLWFLWDWMLDLAFGRNYGDGELLLVTGDFEDRDAEKPGNQRLETSINVPATVAGSFLLMVKIAGDIFFAPWGVANLRQGKSVLCPNGGSSVALHAWWPS